MIWRIIEKKVLKNEFRYKKLIESNLKKGSCNFLALIWQKRLVEKKNAGLCLIVL